MKPGAPLGCIVQLSFSSGSARMSTGSGYQPRDSEHDDARFTPIHVHHTHHILCGLGRRGSGVSRTEHTGQLTSSGSSSILEPVLRFRRRLSAAVLAMVIATANGAVCAGWMPTPEARMACCSEGGACSMHKGESGSSATERVLTQAQADNCCASSERENSSPSSPTFAPASPARSWAMGSSYPSPSLPSVPERRVAAGRTHEGRPRSQTRSALRLPRLAIHSRRVSARTPRPGA